MHPLLFALLLLSSLATAETAGRRTCRILFLGATDTAPETLHLYDGVTSQEVELPRMNLSPVYQLSTGERSLKMLSAAPARPEDVSPDAPSVMVPENVSDLYLLLSTDPNNKVAPVRMQIIDVDSSKFKKGQILWFNLSANSVGGQVGSEKLAMAANSRTLMNAPASKREDYVVNLAFRIEGNPELYPLCETKWLHHPDSRSVFFVIAQPGSRTPRVLGFRDYRAAGGEKAAAP